VVAAAGKIPLPSIAALGFLANEPRSLAALFNRLFTDPTSLQIKAAMAAPSAERITRIGNWR
jgi:hypothetical protein